MVAIRLFLKECKRSLEALRLCEVANKGNCKSLDDEYKDITPLCHGEGFIARRKKYIVIVFRSSRLHEPDWAGKHGNFAAKVVELADLVVHKGFAACISRDFEETAKYLKKHWAK